MTERQPAHPRRRPDLSGPAATLIVGNGPSVDDVGEAFWQAAAQRCRLVGTNRATVLAACRAGRRPLDWVALVLRDRYRALWEDPRLGERYHRRHWRSSSAWTVGPAQDRSTHCDEYVRFVPGWQQTDRPDANGESAVMAQHTVVLMAVNWVWLAGARRIGLIGVDYRGGHGRMIAPFDERATRELNGAPARIERQFARAAEAISRAGGELVNLSPQTCLQAVRRVDWRDVLPGGSSSAGQASAPPRPRRRRRRRRRATGGGR
jgi:hypothetical protein